MMDTMLHRMPTDSTKATGNDNSVERKLSISTEPTAESKVLRTRYLDRGFLVQRLHQ